MDPVAEFHQYLKVACSVFNSLEGSRRSDLKVKDLDNLTSETMMAIILSLIQHFEACSADLETKISPLPYFDTFGVSNDLTYDSTADYIYSRARKYLIPEDDMLDMSVILLPAQDPKRTKQVIYRLTTFFLFCDQLNDTFQNEWERLNRENQEKSELYTEIDLIKNQIAEKVRENQEKEEIKPQLEDELAAIDRELLKEQELLAQLEVTANQEKKNYDSKAADNIKLAAKLKTLDVEKAALEGQIVSCPGDAIEAYKKVELELKRGNSLRESLGEDLKKAGKQEQFLQDMIENAGRSIVRFKKLIANMETAGEYLSAHGRGSSSYKIKLKEIEEIKKAGNQLELQRQRTDKEIKNRLKVIQQKTSDLEERKKKKQEKAEYVQSSCQEYVASCKVATNQIQSIDDQIRSLTAEIKEHIQFAEVEIPQRQAALESQMDDLWNQIHSLYAREGLAVGVADFEEEDR